MGMSTHAVGFRPPDREWENMRDVWLACEAASIDPPRSVVEFFDGKPPDDSGVEVSIDAKEWADDSRSGLEIDIAELPAGVKKIRFFNSW